MRFFVLLFSLVAALSAEEWSHDYGATLAKAQKENKQIYMLITSQHCRWCRKFERTTLQEDIVLAKLTKTYLLLHVDRDLDTFPEKFIRQSVPRHYFLSPKGEVVYSFLGFWNQEDFFSFLEDVEQRYARMSKNNQGE